MLIVLYSYTYKSKYYIYKSKKCIHINRRIITLYQCSIKWMMTCKYKNKFTKLYSYKYRNNYTSICI